MGGEGLVKDVSLFHSLPLLHSLSLHTPCHVQDPALAEQVLSDNFHDVDLAIVELLQLMDLDQGKFCVLASLPSSLTATAHGKCIFTSLPALYIWCAGIYFIQPTISTTCHLINSFSN